ncbi:hypothetical protein Syun_014127 [Stephania yunnanensis]|uniref:Uncharacterized protein n=1 Tax=Stephania yunnanensis TaxID=152371 RepID=A0AAP0P8G9_9MAGN
MLALCIQNIFRRGVGVRVMVMGYIKDPKPRSRLTRHAAGLYTVGGDTHSGFYADCIVQIPLAQARLRLGKSKVAPWQVLLA